MDKKITLGSNIQESPEDFRTHMSSAVLNTELANTKNIDSFLKKYKRNMIPRNLPMHLEMLLEKKKLKKADVARDSQIDRKYVCQIFSGEKNPSRDKLILIAFGLHLSDMETQTMLKLSGKRELYVRDVRDVIILSCLQNRKTVWETNDMLFRYGFELLGDLKG